MAIILSVNNNLDVSLRALGHTVYSVSITDGGFYAAQNYVSQCPEEPDFFFQKEALATHVFFTDVQTLSCTTAFWGIDSHLRYGWQRHYAALFDVFFTPHKAFLQRLHAEWLHPHMHRLVECGFESPYIPHAQRTHAMNFVGRLTAFRPQRQAICQKLQERYGLAHVENISMQAMRELYAQTRIVPNESIANEVNFRLMEGASCGCAVVTPQVGADQDTLFEPDKEILIYTSMDSFTEHMDRCLHDASFCEALGQRAWRRVQKEHLPIHMATTVMEKLQEYTYAPAQEVGFMPSRRQRHDALAEKNCLLGTLHLYDIIALGQLPTFLRHMSTENTARALILRVFLLFKEAFAQEKQGEGIKEAVYALLDAANVCLMGGSCSVADKKSLAVACGGAALYFDDAARSHFYAYMYEKLWHPEQKSSSKAVLKGAQGSLDVALNWAHILLRDQKQCLFGSDYVPGCCQTAFDFVTLCQHYDQHDMRWVAALLTLDQVVFSYPFAEQDRLRQILMME